MSAWRKLKVFAPQLVMAALALGCIDAGVALAVHGTAVVFPFVAIGAVSGALSGITAINKAVGICDYNGDGWETYAGECEACERKRAEIESLKQALISDGGRV